MRGKVGGGPGVGRDRSTRAQLTGKGEGPPPARGCALRGKVGGGPRWGKTGEKKGGELRSEPEGERDCPRQGRRGDS